MTDLAKSLPTYQQIESWLGGPESGWTMLDGGELPWGWWYPTNAYHCRLLHTDGTRATLRAPEEPMPTTVWCDWFRYIRGRSAFTSRYLEHVTWQHPQPATDLGECAACGACGASPVCTFYGWCDLCGPCSKTPLLGKPRARRSEVVELGTLAVGEWFEFADFTDVVPQARCRHQVTSSPYCTTLDEHNVTWTLDRRRKVRRVPPPQTQAAEVLDRFKAYRKAEATAFLAEHTCSTKSCHNPATVDGLCGACRWPGVAAELWPGHEALLAQQVASGGQSGEAARAMLVRRESERDAAMNRSVEKACRRVEDERLRKGEREMFCDAMRLTPGPRMWRHELPSDQRLDRKRSGR